MSTSRTAAKRPAPVDPGKACPVCGSKLCADLTRAAGQRWREQAAVRASRFHDLSKFPGLSVDPGTVCQTTLKPLPTATT